MMVDRVLHPDVERLGSATVDAIIPSVIKFVILDSNKVL
jgi:hypothetical protein